jgi:hypothetical protein
VNYLAHGFRHVHDPWFVAGTALPDWLRVLDRRARVSAERAEAHRDHDDPRVRSLALGVLRHHEDDRRFHGSVAFDETRRAVADTIRPALPAADGHRPWFVAHLVLEVQLDASITAESPTRLDDYYAALGSLDADAVAAAARTLTEDGAPARLAELVRRFRSERFLFDYAEPRSALRRLDRVVRSVRQPGLPEALADVLPVTRGHVEARRDELLA